MKKFSVTGTLLSIALLASSSVLAQTQSPGKQVAQNELKPDKKSLVPSEEERQKYTDVLKASGARLIRLLPREKYDVQASRESGNAAQAGSFPRQTSGDNNHLNDVPQWDSYPRAVKTSRSVRGGGAYYSFTRRDHDYGNSSHLSLESGRFKVGFSGANYGFLTDLGDVPLESLALDTPAVNVLATYSRAQYDREARREHRRFQNSINTAGTTVETDLPMRQHSTYLVRAINYDDSDVLVAFRVVEIEPDGSALIVWRMLKRYSTPRLER